MKFVKNSKREVDTSRKIVPKVICMSSSSDESEEADSVIIPLSSLNDTADLNTPGDKSAEPDSTPIISANQEIFGNGLDTATFMKNVKLGLIQEVSYEDFMQTPVADKPEDERKYLYNESNLKTPKATHPYETVRKPKDKNARKSCHISQVVEDKMFTDYLSPTKPKKCNKKKLNKSSNYYELKTPQKKGKLLSTPQSYKKEIHR